MRSHGKLYTAWCSEGFCAPLLSSKGKTSLLDWAQAADSLDAQSERWGSEPLTWRRNTNADLLPDMSIYPVRHTCSAAAARLLWPNDTRDFELLPIQVEGDPWHLMRCTHFIKEIVEHASDINWLEYSENDKIIRWASEIRWVNVLDQHAISLDAFKLTIQPKGPVFFSQQFVDRYRALGLSGIRFEHCGYIVDKPEDAVPPPARPVPRIEQAPRWPNWEAAPDEEVTRFTQAGETFLQARGLSASSEPSAVLAALATEIEAHRSCYAKHKSQARKELLSGLAGAFGLLLRHQLHWNWVDLPVTSRAWDLGLESPNGSHALCLNQVMVRQLTSHEPSTIVLLFNMIAAGNLPDGQAGDHVAIG